MFYKRSINNMPKVERASCYPHRTHRTLDQPTPSPSYRTTVLPHHRPAAVLFGENDPANMGTIPRAMLTLWIASPRAHNVMYINMYGCAEYHGQLYEEVCAQGC